MLEIITESLPELVGPCKIWAGPLDELGYGRTYAVSGSTTHVVAWTLYHNKPVPKGYELDHLCNNRACYEVKHLETVTRSENMRRAHVRRYGNACKKGHPRTPENFGNYNTTGRRYCKACKKETQARFLLANPGYKRAKYIAARVAGGFRTPA